MTAEIAVMNRFAVALAADSAVTVGQGDSQKVFQTENKLFEVSEHKPVGLMIYSGTEFFDVPWEIIIKDFRAKHGSEPCETIFGWAPRFFDYVSSIFLPSKEKQEAYVARILEEEFNYIFDKFYEETGPLIAGGPHLVVRGEC